MNVAKIEAAIRFGPDGLVPAVIQDAGTGEVLTLCYLNREALRRTVDSGKVHLWRRSAGRLMIKGESSGHVQQVVEMGIDCEGKSVVIKVKQKGGACHRGYYSCYYRWASHPSGELETRGSKVFDPEKVYAGDTKK